METLRLLKDRRDMTLLTNSVEALHELGTSSLSVVSTGGILNPSSMSLQGAIAKKTISNYNVDILLMSCKGLDMDKGALDSNEDVYKRQFLNQSILLRLGKIVYHSQGVCKKVGVNLQLVIIKLCALLTQFLLVDAEL